MLGYIAVTSAVTKIALSGTEHILQVLLIKSPELLMQDKPLLIIGCNWLSKNSDNFFVGVPQLLITGLPGTFDNRYDF